MQITLVWRKSRNVLLNISRSSDSKQLTPDREIAEEQKPVASIALAEVANEEAKPVTSTEPSEKTAEQCRCSVRQEPRTEATTAQSSRLR
jgi:hypothetical protein